LKNNNKATFFLNAVTGVLCNKLLPWKQGKENPILAASFRQRSCPKKQSVYSGQSIRKKVAENETGLFSKSAAPGLLALYFGAFIL